MNRNVKNRVLIRPPNSGDCDAFLAVVRRSRAIHRNWISPKAKTPAAFDKYLKKFEAGPHHGFLVIHRDTGDIVGVINLNEVIRGNFQSAFVGYYAFQPYAGKGLMREGLRLVLKHAFHKLKLHRVEANIQPNNHASLALAKSCGFGREGLARRLAKVCGRWKDHERWAILAENFPVATRR
ncbi:MAG TPA: GNAT family N-acetyltransferase [Candidatus Limnocylindrales bacterium]|nr:GNAT family N-acetyltransferase [Candidatus Limnocylindrales bacterium]